MNPFEFQELKNSYQLPSHALRGLREHRTTFRHQEKDHLRMFDLQELIEHARSERIHHLAKHARVTGRQAALLKLHERTVKFGPYWPFANADIQIDELTDRYPNLANVIESLASDQALSGLENRFELSAPLLLVGPPGCGKTDLITHFARHSRIGYSTIDCATASAGWAITGLGQGWSSATTGEVMNLFFRSRQANPFIIFDELDKSGGDDRFSVFDAMTQLFEKETARVFSDECLKIPFDASYLNIVATANDPETIPPPTSGTGCISSSAVSPIFASAPALWPHSMTTSGQASPGAGALAKPWRNRQSMVWPNPDSRCVPSSANCARPWPGQPTGPEKRWVSVWRHAISSFRKTNTREIPCESGFSEAGDRRSLSTVRAPPIRLNHRSISRVRESRHPLESADALHRPVCQGCEPARYSPRNIAMARSLRACHRHPSA